VPVPKDNDNLLSKIDQLEAEENGKLAEFLKGIAKEVEVLKTEVKCTLIYLQLVLGHSKIAHKKYKKYPMVFIPKHTKLASKLYHIIILPFNKLYFGEFCIFEGDF
jgi:hypothetical protein